MSVPRVSIIVSALNEASTIEPALRSLLGLDYPNYEVIAINDRSSDSTGQILNILAQSDKRLKVHHIHKLPSGWLGKNHALHLGAQHASGQYLLFTDADITFSTQVLAQAINYCQINHVDHLSLIFRVIANTPLLKMTMASLSSGLMALFQPWKVATSNSHYFGIGAFNFVRREAYLKSGGHAAIAMAVLDDIELGKIIKQNGFKQAALLGLGSVSVEWYPSVIALIKGLEKNVFCGFKYRLGLVAAATVSTLVMRVLPWLSVIAAEGLARGLSVLTVIVIAILYAFLLKKMNWGYRPLLYLPVVCFIELFVWWRGSLITIARGGISWRGTFYPLKELRTAMRTSQTKVHRQKRRQNR